MLGYYTRAQCYSANAPNTNCNTIFKATAKGGRRKALDVAWNSTGTRLVTCGLRHVSFWNFTGGRNLLHCRGVFGGRGRKQTLPCCVFVGDTAVVGLPSLLRLGPVVACIPLAPPRSFCDSALYCIFQHQNMVRCLKGMGPHRWPFVGPCYALLRRTLNKYDILASSSSRLEEVKRGRLQEDKRAG